MAAKTNKMNKLSIRIEFDGKVINGLAEEIEDEQQEQIKQLVEHAVLGDMEYMELDTSEGTAYIPEAVLVRSVITIVNHKEQEPSGYSNEVVNISF